MEDKSIITLRNRINQLELYIKRNLEPTIMSLYMDIDRLNKKIKSITNEADRNDHEILNENSNNAENAAGASNSSLENAIQTMELLKQRTKRISGVQNVRTNSQMMANNQMQSKVPVSVGVSGRVIDN
jgi:hypothetical protein